ncbi:hypothetical protein BJF79_06310 [Actinomadura sp. CNU-125]|uniref:hypothetical protein n=1 Tax=Actinomadura sp. CNU-125 TaxID=1904961 RepID=UPI00095FF702|nr:hypothetical protein [Actinomadura sp. CNU-125]OLT36983.1 hypothetical protein BJF79_06310 [Actinomadura sp. CNU-125]
MQWSVVAGYGVAYGLALSVAFTAAVFAGAAMSRDFLLNDYPPAIQERYGRPKSVRGRRVAALFGVVVWGLCGLPLMIAAMAGLDGALDDGLTFLPAALCAALVFATLSLWDLVVFDWIIFAGLRPRLLALPGTEGMAEYRDLRFHLGAAIKGSPLIVVVGLVTGSIAALLT